MNKNLKKKFNRKKLKRLIEKSYEPKIQNVNPFDMQYNKRKTFNKIANKSSGVKRAEQKRKDTLLVEYKKRNTRNKIIDLRIGDNTINNNLNSQKLIKEKQRQSKRNVFNLNENEELTHMGTSLSEIESFEKLNEQIEDKEINADLVSKLHFGGFESNAENEKGTKTYLQELISINKKEKFEKQKEKENLDEFRERLDQTWKELRMTVSSSYNKKDEVNVNDKSNKDDSNVKDQHLSIPFIETNKQNGTFELESYDAIFKSLQYENKVTDNSVSAANQTLFSQKSNESKALNKADNAISNERDCAKIKKYVSTYSADALSFDECVDYGSKSKENANATSSQLGPKFELVYDENGQIASSLLKNLSRPDGEEMIGNDCKGGDKLLSRASGIMKDIKINLFLKSTHTPPASNEIAGKVDEIALPFFSYQYFCQKLLENSVKSYARLLPLLDDPTIYKSLEAILRPEKHLTERDKNLFSTLHLISNTITYTLRYLVELNAHHNSKPADYRDTREKLCSLLVACKFFVSRPNLICLVMEKVVESLSRYVFAYTTKTFLVHSKRRDNNPENIDPLNYPGRKLFTFTTSLATLFHHLPSTDFAKLRQRVVYLLNTNLGHLSHILPLKSALIPSILNDLVRKGCYLVTSLVELSSLTKFNAVYYPEPFAFFMTALEKITTAIRDPSDSQISEELSLLLDTLPMFLRSCLSPLQVQTGDAKLHIEWSPLLAAFPELLKDLKTKLKPLSEYLIDCEASSKVLRLMDEAIAQIKGERASHNFDANPAHKNGSGKTLKYPKLLEPLLEAPKHSAAWRREQRSKHLKNKKVGVGGDNDGYYLATPESLAERKRLKHMYKRDLKTAKKELRKDALFLARHQLQEQMEKDKSRKEKVKRLYAILADQEGECRAIKKTKIRANF